MSLTSRPPATTRFLLAAAVVFLLAGGLAAPLSAQTVPGAPTGLTATLLTSVTVPAGSVQLTWVAPASGSPITGYTLTASGGKSCTTTGALSCTVSGLSPSTSYSFTVTATSAAGTGPASPAVTFMTPGLPAAPATLVVSTAPRDGSITLNWGPPASDGGTPINSYTIACYRSGGGSTAAHPGGVRYTWTFTGLPNNIANNCYAWAHNAMGQGAASNMVSATPVASTTGSTWVQIGTGMTFTSATVRSANSYGGIVNGQHYEWNGTSWASDGKALKQVAYGNDGERWGVDSTSAIYRGASWTTVPGGLSQISVGSAQQVWGVNANDSIYRWTATGWQNIPGGLSNVAVAADGTVWGVQRTGSIYRWSGSGWQSIPGGLSQI